MEHMEQEGYDPSIVLRDETGRSLTCHIERSLEVNNHEYLLLMPIDAPIEIFAWQTEEGEDEELLMDVEDSDIDPIFPTAKAVLAEQNLTLYRTALTLTASGDLPEATEDDCFTLELADVEEGSDLEAEEFQVLATFFYKDEEYTVCTPLEPLLFFAHKNSSGEPELVSPEEFQKIRAQLEDQLFDVLD